VTTKLPTTLRALALIVFLATVGSLPAAINIDNFSTATNDRFANDPSFIAASYDLSGIALNNSGRWLTMISPNVFISAEHFRPAPSSSVTFYASNDPAGASATRTVSNTFTQVGATDLYLGTLTSPLGPTYAYYDFVTQDINNLADFLGSAVFLEDALLFGRSPTTSFPTSQEMSIGENRIDSVGFSINAASNTGDAVVTTDDVPADPNYLTYESFLQVGDSGAPMMVDFGSGNLTIVGINWFIGQNGANEDINGHTYVGNYDQDIQAFIDANPVPEPQAFGLFLAIVAAGFVFGRRSSRLR